MQEEVLFQVVCMLTGSSGMRAELMTLCPRLDVETLETQNTTTEVRLFKRSLDQVCVCLCLCVCVCVCVFLGMCVCVSVVHVNKLNVDVCSVTSDLWAVSLPQIQVPPVENRSADVRCVV